MQKEGTRAISSATPLPAKVKSFTREEIDRYWRMRRMVEEDHLLFAEKAAARIRAKAHKEEDQRRFEELLKEMLEEKGEEEKADAGENKELQIGIKDWWTKSKYAYLNQPAIKSMGMEEKKASGPYEACVYLFPPVEPYTPFGVY